MVMCAGCISAGCISKGSMTSLTISSLQEGYGKDLAIIDEVLGKTIFFKVSGLYSAGKREVESSSTTPLFPMPVFSRDLFRLEDSKTVDLDKRKLVKPLEKQVDAFFGIGKDEDVVYIVVDRGSSYGESH